jgi:hypothetical protein
MDKDDAGVGCNILGDENKWGCWREKEEVVAAKK